MSLRPTARWTLSHLPLRLATARRGKARNADALIVLDPQRLEDHTAHLATLRAGRPFAAGTFGPLTVHHDVCKAILRSEGSRIPEVLPGPVRRAPEVVGVSGNPGPGDPPSMLVTDGP